jgi:hypothetical protein
MLLVCYLRKSVLSLDGVALCWNIDMVAWEDSVRIREVTVCCPECRVVDAIVFGKLVQGVTGPNLISRSRREVCIRVEDG